MFNPSKIEKKIVSVRMENPLLETIDKLAFKSDISRNRFIIQCIEYALENLNSDITMNN